MGDREGVGRVVKGRERGKGQRDSKGDGQVRAFGLMWGKSQQQAEQGSHVHWDDVCVFLCVYLCGFLTYACGERPYVQRAPSRNLSSLS